MLKGLLTLTRYWIPPRIHQTEIAPKLERFYAEREDYHAMTAGVTDKASHPQVRLLFSLISSTDKVVEFGCGGGVVLAAAGELAAEATGFDIGTIPVANANLRPGKHRAIVADVTRLPLPDNYADVVYSTEVLEHVWDPTAVIREMIRVVKPGGVVFFSTPNGYAMNLHLRLSAKARAVNHVGAAVSLALSAMRSQPYENIPPDLEANPLYSDCDMITRLHPRSLVRFVESCGCRVERLETFLFQREKATSEAERKRYERLERHPFYHWHGDHIVFVGRKM